MLFMVYAGLLAGLAGWNWYIFERAGVGLPWRALIVAPFVILAIASAIFALAIATSRSRR